MKSALCLHVMTIRCCIGWAVMMGGVMSCSNAWAQDQGLEGSKAALESEKKAVRDAAVEDISNYRSSVISMLISVVDEANAGKASRESRNAAARLLGRFRAPEAIPVLSRALATLDATRLSPDIDPSDDAVFSALVAIGRPVMPQMILNITTSDNESLRMRSIDVANQVLGGKGNLLALLKRLYAREKGNDLKVARIRKAIAWAQSHYSETRRPLF